MTIDPLNMLPVDPKVTKAADDAAEELVRQTGHTVFLMVMKDGGKTHIVMKGVPDSGFLAEVSKDVPKFLELTAGVLRLHEWVKGKMQ